MNRPSRIVPLLVTAALVATLPAAAATAADRGVAPAALADARTLSRALTAEDGWSRVSYPRREGVQVECSDLADGGRPVLDDGLVHVTVRAVAGAVTDLEARSGPRPAHHERQARQLGRVSAASAATCFLALADRARDPELAAAALTAAALADTVTWPRILIVARDRERAAELRQAAIFWLGMAAGDKVERELTAIVDDASEELAIREHAVFALHQACEDDPARAVATLGRIATENPHPQVRRSALFWLAQHDDPAVVALFEAILLD